MIAPDTNLLVRVITQDDPSQARAAAEVLRSDHIWIAKTVVLETAWVLSHAYGLSRHQVLHALRTLVGLNNATVEDGPAVEAALAWHAAGMDVADALHLASSRPADAFVTFDRHLSGAADRAKDAVPVRLLKCDS